jgi:hypothetical protein
VIKTSHNLAENQHTSVSSASNFSEGVKSNQEDRRSRKAQPLQADKTSHSKPTEGMSDQQRRNVANLIAKTLEGWSKAWRTKQVDQYLHFYGKAFQPSGNISRSAWEEQRRKRIGQPASIQLSLRKVKLKPLKQGHYRIRFVQRFKSGAYQDCVLKQLILSPEQGRFVIVQEQTAPTKMTCEPL